MRFLELRIRNFLSFQEEQTLDLRDAGLICVSGFNRDSRSSDSNGAGKSTIMEAMLWCLWGTTLRKLKSDEVINRSASSDCLVSTKLEDESGQVYEITRTRRSKSSRKTTDLLVTVNSSPVTAGVNADTQQIVNAIIGMDMDTFTQSVLLSTGNRSFCEMTDAEQKAVLDDILRLDQLTTARRTVRDLISKKQSELSSVSGQLAALEHERGTHLAQLDNLRQRSCDYEMQRWRKRYGQEADRAQLFLELENLCESVSYVDARDELELADGEYQEALENSETLAEATQDLVTEYLEKRNELSQKLTFLRERERQVHQDSGQLNQLAGAVCPTCKQQVSVETAEEHMSLWEAKLKQIEELRKKISNAIDDTHKEEKSKRDGFSKQQQSCVERLRTAKDVLQIARDKVTKAEFAINQIPQLETHIQRITEHINNMRTEQSPYVPLIEQCKIHIESMRSSIAVQQYRKRSLDLEVQHLVFWDQGFGNQGMRSYLLDSVTPFLTERAQKYADVMSEGDLTIRFDTQTQLKGGKWKEQFNVIVENSQGADVYRGNSSGEKRRSDVAVGWALGDLAATRAHKPIRFKGLDEPFENLDGTGQDAVIKLLYAVLPDYETVLCITHRDHLRNQFPKEICVVKENGSSKIQSP